MRASGKRAEVLSGERPQCAPQGQTAGMGDMEHPAPDKDGLAGLGLEHQMQPDEAPRGRQLLL